jgi:hypothetical protein
MNPKNRRCAPKRSLRPNRDPPATHPRPKKLRRFAPKSFLRLTCDSPMTQKKKALRAKKRAVRPTRDPPMTHTHTTYGRAQPRPQTTHANRPRPACDPPVTQPRPARDPPATHPRPKKYAALRAKIFPTTHLRPTHDPKKSALRAKTLPTTQPRPTRNPPTTQQIAALRVKKSSPRPIAIHS